MTLKLQIRSLLKRSPTSTAINILTTLVVLAALINLANGFKPLNGEGRKLFGGYRITPKQCRATKTLPSSDPRAKGPTICMFNHECAQRNGEVVGACMDGFLFGACCQVPLNQQTESTLINDAQNSYYHQYQNNKLQQQESETNKFVSQAYETFGENSAQQQSLENSQPQHDTVYGGGNNVIEADDVENLDRLSQESQQQEQQLPQQDTSEQANASTDSSSTESNQSNASFESNVSKLQSSTEAQTPPKISVNKDSVKISSPSQSPHNDDFVLQVLNTMPPGDANSLITFTTEIPMKISNSLTQHISSESNSFEEEVPSASARPIVKQPENQEVHHHSNVQHQNTEQIFGGVTFSHSDITHPGADADLIEDDLQFSTGYGPQPVIVPAPAKQSDSYDNQAGINKVTSNLYDATTSSSSITTHVDSIETIIQQLNNNNSNPGPSYSVINQHQEPQSSTYGIDKVTASSQPEAYDQSTSSSYNEIEQNEKQTSTPQYEPSSTSAVSGDSTTSNLVYGDELELEDHTMPLANYNDYQASKHPTSDFNKMPVMGIAYPVDMSYMEEDNNLVPDSYQQPQQNPPTINLVANNYQQQQQQQQQQIPQTNNILTNNYLEQHQQQEHQQQQQQVTNKYQAQHQQQEQQHMQQVTNKYQEQHQQQEHQQQQEQEHQQQQEQVTNKYQEQEQHLEQQQQQHMQQVTNKYQEQHQQQEHQQQQDQIQQANNVESNNYQQPQQQQQQQQQQHQQEQQISHDSYDVIDEEQKVTEPQTVQNYVIENHQRPIASYIGVVTSQNYNSQPLPHEVVVSSYTTKVEENLDVSTEYRPIITSNSYQTTSKPVKKTSPTSAYTNRPNLVTKRPSSKIPTKTSNKKTTTSVQSSANSVSIQQQQQQQYSTTPIETKTPTPPEPIYSKPTPAYNQGFQDEYISSGSTPKPVVVRKPTKKTTNKPVSTSYITGPTTPRPEVTPQYQYDQEVPVIVADDKLDSFVHSTAESLASALPTQETLSYDPPVYAGSQQQPQNQRPQYNTHKKPGFVKVQATQRPPVPTVHITPKPSSLQTMASSYTTAQHTTPLPGYGSTSYVYNSLVTRRPDFVDNNGGDYVGISTVNSNDFDDPGYYGNANPGKPAQQPTFMSEATESVYPVPTDDKPAFPGYYGPTPTYPAFPVPGEKLESQIDEESYTSPNDFVNFPPVRNPNLNMSATSSSVTSDLELSTPAFVEDSVLKNKMNTLVHKIVESLQGNFEALSDMIDESNNTAPVQTYQASTTVVTKKPTRKPSTRLTTPKPKATTKKPVTRVTTKAPPKRTVTTRKPETTTKKPAVRRTTTTTRKPVTRKPTRKITTTTKAPAEDELVDEEDEEDVNPSENEIAEEEDYGSGTGGRKLQCGMRPHVKSGRIVGGKGATFGAYPWQVLVRESTWLGLFTKNKCGGVLITSRYVITAAHCQPGFLASLVAVMGEFDISGDLESKRAITKNVKRVIVHRQYDPATFENDIALLELDSPVTFDTHIVPICMPTDVADFTGRMATVTGWGRLKYGGGVPSVLQEVQVPVIENSVCQEMFVTAGHNKKILNSFLCAGYANGQKDSCEGDSGGPLVLQRADGRYELAGTVSHGIKCAAPYLPGVYMRTTFYKPWLRSITGVK